MVAAFAKIRGWTLHRRLGAEAVWHCDRLAIDATNLNHWVGEEARADDAHRLTSGLPTLVGSDRSNGWWWNIAISVAQRVKLGIGVGHHDTLGAQSVARRTASDSG